MITRKQSRSGIKVILDAMKRHESNADVQQLCTWESLYECWYQENNRRVISRWFWTRWSGIKRTLMYKNKVVSLFWSRIPGYQQTSLFSPALVCMYVSTHRRRRIATITSSSLETYHRHKKKWNATSHFYIFDILFCPSKRPFSHRHSSVCVCRHIDDDASQPSHHRR